MNEKRKYDVLKRLRKELRGETPRERLLHRLHCVVMVLSGYSANAASKIYGDSSRAVAYWVSRFNKAGLRGLDEDQRPGRPSKLNARQLNRLQKFIKQSGSKSESVNAEALAQFILTEFRISLTTRQCWRILNKLKS